jgi:hypothetical protein
MSDYFDSSTEFLPAARTFFTGGKNMENSLQQAHATVFTATATNKQAALIAGGLTSVEVQDSTLELYACEGWPAPDVAAWGAHTDRAPMNTWPTPPAGTSTQRSRAPGRAAWGDDLDWPLPLRAGYGMVEAASPRATR